MLYLIRHAEAGDAARDEMRTLTARGRRDAARVGAFLAASRALEVQEIWHSTLVRAKETAAIIAAEAGLKGLREVNGLAPEDDPAAIAARVSGSRAGIALVGHNPHLTRLATLLVKGESAAAPVVHFSKCAVLALETLDSGQPGSWTIAWFLAPELFGVGV